MIIYKRPVPFRNDYILRKRKLDKKQKKALDKVDEILDELEESIIDALIFMWAREAELVDISAVETAMQNPGNTYGIIAPFGDVLDDFVDDTLRPTMTHIGNEGYQEAREQIDELMIIEPPEVQKIPLLPPGADFLLLPPAADVPLLPPAAEEDEVMTDDEPPIEEVPITPPPIGDDEQTEEVPEKNAFDYAAFYEQWCDEHTGELIVDINDTQLADVKSIINTAINEGMSPEMAARRIADTVGLTERQLKANENYYNAIREQLAKDNPVLSQEEIDKRAAALAAEDASRKRRIRARSIARTEINIAHHKANEAYIKWAVEHGYMDAPDKEWVTSNKGNVCDKCLRLSQRAVPYDQEFTLDGFAVGLPPIHPQCCCAIIYVNHTEGRIYPTESEWDKMSEFEKKVHINYFSDKAQYEAYKKRLGKENVPKTLAEFQQMKYNNTKEMRKLEQFYRNVGNGPTIKNANGRNVKIVNKTTLHFRPNSITEVHTAKGGITRNYYDKNADQYKQISNNGHDHKEEEALGEHGEHAHDYFFDEDGNLQRGKARELNKAERKENEDIL